MGDPYRSADVDYSRAIRSIRVAAALNDQFGVLAQPKTYTERDELSRVIGEARQIYPEIWSNLDDARTALAQRSIDVAAYDELRAHQATRAGGVLDVEATEGARIPVGGGGTTKSAWMNLEGHALAKQACDVMRRALPNVDWDALDRAEAEEIAAAGSLRPARWKAAVLSVIGLVLCGALVAFYLMMRIKGGR